MSNVYDDTDESERMGGLESSKNQRLAHAPLSALQKRRAALEELDEAKFSVSTHVHMTILVRLQRYPISHADPVVVSRSNMSRCRGWFLHGRIRYFQYFHRGYDDRLCVPQRKIQHREPGFGCQSSPLDRYIRRTIAIRLARRCRWTKKDVRN